MSILKHEQSIEKVTYTTYPLGGVRFFNAGLQTQHAGLCVRGTDGSEQEYHMTDHGFQVRDKCGSYRPKKLGEYEIKAKPDITKDDLHQKLNERFKGSKYQLGKNDCFSVPEYTATLFNQDKRDLGGPVGDRKGLANGTRHTVRSVGGCNIS